MTDVHQPFFTKQGFPELIVRGFAFVKSKFLSIIPSLVLVLITSGCASTINHAYEWSEYPIKSERVSQTISSPVVIGVQIINGQSQTDDEELGVVGYHHYSGSMKQLTEAIVAQFSTELVKRGIRVDTSAPKSLDLKVISREFIRGLWVIRTDMVLQVKHGSGIVYELDISNTTGGTVPRLYDGAVSVATIALLNDPRVKAYLERP